MKTKIEIKSVFGELLFELEKENNSIKDTLMEAIKRGANLSGANLSGANLSGASLSDASLSDANLSDANLSGANLSGADANENTTMFFIQCPTEGSFIAWKKAGDKIVKLEICSDAKRSSSTSLKCRCSKAKVLEIQELNGEKSNIKSIASNHDRSFWYNVGEIVEVSDFDENRWNECASGIHFFIDRNMAVAY